MSGAWEYHCREGWEKFPHDISSRVELAYQRGERSVKYSIRNHTYRIIFAESKQYRSDDSTKVRTVRRCQAARVGSSMPSGRTNVLGGGRQFTSVARGFLLPEDEEIVFFLRKINLQRFINFFHRQGARTVMDIKFLLDSREVTLPQEMTLLDKKHLQEALSQWGVGTFDEFHNMPPGELSKGLPKFEDIDWKKWLGFALTVVIVVLVCVRAWIWLFPATIAAAPVIAVAPVAAVAADCVDEDAEVTKYDRSRKKIKHIRVGDDVLSFNAGRFLVKKVRDIKISSSNEMFQVRLKKVSGDEFDLHVTPGHPLWVSKTGWAVLDPSKVAHAPNGERLRMLQIGDNLLLGDAGNGESVSVVAIRKCNRKRTTYNLIVDGPGTFFANGILMHSGLPPKI